MNKTLPNRFFSYIICICLLWLCLSPSTYSYPAAKALSPSYDGILSLDTPVTLFLSPDPQKGYRDATYQFIPTESGNYTFYSISDLPTACYLRGSSGMTIDSDYTHQGRGQNFSLTCSLSANVTYYFTAQFSASSSAEGSFDICIIKTPDSSSFTDTISVGVDPKGIKETISTPRQTIRMTFTPPETCRYALYQLPSCSCSSEKHSSDCTYIQDLSISIAQKESDTSETLKRIGYSSSSGKTNGFLIYDTFYKDITYYIEIEALDNHSTGEFKLGISNTLSDAPVDSWGSFDERCFTLDNNTEAIYLQTQISGSIHLSSTDGSYIYAQLLSASGDIISESNHTDQFMNFTDSVVSGSYYIRIYTDQSLTQEFHVTLNLLEPTAPPEVTSSPNVPVISSTPLNSDNPPAPTASSSPDSPIPTDASDTGAANIPNATPHSTASLSNAVLSKIPDQVYTGKKIKPSLKLSLGQTRLKKGTDYTVSFQNNKKIGTAIIIISGKGAYSNQQLHSSFRIVPPAPKYIKLRKQGTTLTISWNKVKQATGYELQYGTNKAYKRVAKRKTSKTNLTISIQNGKKYYIRLRTYKTIAKKKYYSFYCKQPA